MATIRSYSEARAVCPEALTLISNQVGSPWMLEGKRFFPDTDTPIRKMACIRRLLVLAEPVPLTLASLMANSLTRAPAAGLASTETPGRAITRAPRDGQRRGWPGRT